MVNNLLDDTIKKLKKRNEPKPAPIIPDPIIKQGNMLDGMWQKVADYIADITAILMKGKYDVVVKNFPKTQEVKIANIKEFPTPEKQDYSGIMTSLEALQRTIKDIPQLSFPENQKVTVSNQVTPEKIQFPTIQKVEITNHPQHKEFQLPKKFQVEMLNTTDITNSIDSLTSLLTKVKDKGKEENVPQEMISMFEELGKKITDSIEQNRITSVDINNTGSFPVTFPIPTFKDVNGVNTQGRVDSEGNQFTKIKEVLPTDSTKTNGSLTISSDDEVVVNTRVLTKTIDSFSFNKTLSFNSFGELISISSWI